MATDSSVLPWIIAWTEAPGGLQPMGLQSSTRPSDYPHPVALVVNNPPANAGEVTEVLSLGGKDPLEWEMAAHFSIFACRIPWAEEPGGYSP